MSEGKHGFSKSTKEKKMALKINVGDVVVIPKDYLDKKKGFNDEFKMVMKKYKNDHGIPTLTLRGRVFTQDIPEADIEEIYIKAPRNR
jgi:hypothetical protein